MVRVIWCSALITYCSTNCLFPRHLNEKVERKASASSLTLDPFRRDEYGANCRSILRRDFAASSAFVVFVSAQRRKARDREFLLQSLGVSYVVLPYIQHKAKTNRFPLLRIVQHTISGGGGCKGCHPPPCGLFPLAS